VLVGRKNGFQSPIYGSRTRAGKEISAFFERHAIDINAVQF